jgi:DNA-binding beta-propeller fold protein YncE
VSAKSSPSEPTRRSRTAIVALLGAVAVCLLAASGAWAFGELAQKGGTAACVAEDGSHECAPGRGLSGAHWLALSPDGRDVYVSGLGADTIATLERNPENGTLAQAGGVTGCVSLIAPEGCQTTVGIDNPQHLVVSPDGRDVYAASALSGSLSTFARNADGSLTPAGCVSQLGGACAQGIGLAGATGVAVSPDGGDVYVASSISNAVTTFHRDVTTGALTPNGCILNGAPGGGCAGGTALLGAGDLVVSPDGKNVYVASPGSNAVAAFERDPATGQLTQMPGMAGCISSGGGACTPGRNLEGVEALAISADGKNVYVASRLGNAVAVLDRDPATGALTQKAGEAGCISAAGAAGSCLGERLLLEPAGVVVSPDGLTVYVSDSLSSAVSVFDRDPASGNLTPEAAGADCVSELGAEVGCQHARALQSPFGVATSFDNKNVYLADFTAAAVAVFDRNLTRPGPTSKPAPSPPSVSRFKLSPPRFRVAPKGHGSHFRFALSQAADVSIAIEGHKTGRQSKGFARVATLGYPNRRSGANSIAFSGRAGKRLLRPGTYRATIVATDAAGKSSAPQNATFAVLAPARKK